MISCYKDRCIDVKQTAYIARKNDVYDGHRCLQRFGVVLLSRPDLSDLKAWFPKLMEARIRSRDTLSKGDRQLV